MRKSTRKMIGAAALWDTETGRLVMQKIRAAARRQLGCDLESVPRKLLGRDLQEMDGQTLGDWEMLTQHLHLLVQIELTSHPLEVSPPDDDPPELGEADA